jgi:hypothetical protein
MRSGTYCYATFQPKNLDTLKPHARSWIGQRFLFEAMYKQAEDESYPGEWAMYFVRNERASVEFGWAPLSDLEDVVVVCRRCKEPLDDNMLWHEGC